MFKLVPQCDLGKLTGSKLSFFRALVLPPLLVNLPVKGGFIVLGVTSLFGNH